MANADEMQDFNLRLQEIERRLSQLEHPHNAASGPQKLPPPPLDPAAMAEETSFDFALTGKSVLILGGAFLLRAATESAALSKRAGVVVGLLYAIGWMAVAIQCARIGRRTAAVFYAFTAAVIAYPIVWEATTRFGVITAGFAALILASLSIVLIVAGRAFSLSPLAWIAAAGATFDALLLAFATKDVIPFMLELSIVGVVAFLANANFVGAVLAVESNIVAVVLIALPLVAGSQQERAPVSVALVLFALVWVLVWACNRAGCGGLADRYGRRLGIAALRLCTDNSVERRRADGRGDRPARQPEAAGRRFHRTERSLGSHRRRQQRTFSVHCCGGGRPWRSDGDSVAGLRRSGPLSGRFPAKRKRRAPGDRRVRGISIAMYAVSAAAGVASEGAHALLHTVVLSAIATALALAGRVGRLRQASRLAIVLLVLTGAKLALQDLRAGGAALIFSALAVYGIAILSIGRLRRVDVTSSATAHRQ